MHLSTNRQYHKAKVNAGFEVVNFDDLYEFKKIVVFDHAPAVFKDGIRSGANVVTLDCVAMDVDNVDSDVSIEEFLSIFSGRQCYISTSKSHQKEKETGGKVSPPRDRYHVIFSIEREVTKTEYEILTKGLIEKYDFFDKACSDASRFLYGNRDVEVFEGRGEKMKAPACAIKMIENQEFEYSYTSYSNTDKKTVIMSALQVAASRGVFDDYAEWIRVGMALKADSWDKSDWANLSRAGQNQQELEYKWDTFPGPNGHITGGTLIHYARMGDPNCLKSGVSVLAQPIVKKEPTELRQMTTLMLAEPAYISNVPPKSLVDFLSRGIWEEKSVNSKGEESKPRLIKAWYYLIIQHDTELANCIHSDYTIAESITKYDNSRMLDNAIVHRMMMYGVPPDCITKLILDRIKMKIESMNNLRNRVAEMMDKLKYKYSTDSMGDFDAALDDFLSLLEYSAPIGAPYTTEQLRRYYREVWHLFFLRMHLHIDGTKKIDGQYKGLMANDIVPILQGKQGIGKTTLCEFIALKWLNPDFYTDLGSGTKGEFGTQDTAKRCRGRVIAELGEMKLMKNPAAIEGVKSFVSKSTYEIDKKFVEYTAPLPVTVSFIGTSNELEYLNDGSGNRRWWPIWLKTIDKERMTNNKEIIERLHAFYSHLAENIENDKRFDYLKPSESLENFMAYARRESTIQYSDFGAILEVVQKDYEEVARKNTNRYHTLAKHTIEKMIASSGYTMRVSVGAMNQAMEQAGYEKGHVCIAGVTQRGWKKEFVREEY